MARMLADNRWSVSLFSSVEAGGEERLKEADAGRRGRCLEVVREARCTTAILFLGMARLCANGGGVG